jgi:hypothetical protein
MAGRSLSLSLSFAQYKNTHALDKPGAEASRCPLDWLTDLLAGRAGRRHRHESRPSRRLDEMSRKECVCTHGRPPAGRRDSSAAAVDSLGSPPPSKTPAGFRCSRHLRRLPNNEHQRRPRGGRIRRPAQLHGRRRHAADGTRSPADDQRRHWPAGREVESGRQPTARAVQFLPSLARPARTARRHGRRRGSILAIVVARTDTTAAQRDSRSTSASPIVFASSRPAMQCRRLFRF